MKSKKNGRGRCIACLNGRHAQVVWGEYYFPSNASYEAFLLDDVPAEVWREFEEVVVLGNGEPCDGSCGSWPRTKGLLPQEDILRIEQYVAEQYVAALPKG